MADEPVGGSAEAGDGRKETQRTRFSPPRFVVALLGLVGVGVGLWALGNALGNPWISVGIIVFGVVATIPRLARSLLLLACAAVVAILALIGFNVFFGLVMGWLPDGFVDWLPDWIADPGGRLEIRLGLGLAVVVFGGAGYFYLRGTSRRTRIRSLARAGGGQRRAAALPLARWSDWVA